LTALVFVGRFLPPIYEVLCLHVQCSQIVYFDRCFLGRLFI
jgi:hypothetical protein